MASPIYTRTHTLCAGFTAAPKHTRSQSLSLQHIPAGLQHLLCASYNEAFQCFQRCATRFSRTRPALWLRLAECCLHAAADTGVGGPERAVDAVVCESRHAVLLLSRASPKASVDGGTEEAGLIPEMADFSACGGEGATTAQWQPTLAYAGLCLRNLAELLGPDADSAGGDAAILHVALLTSRAYLHLMTSNPRLALADAIALLSESRGSSSRPHEARMLASCYAAEALCALGRPAEAVERLSACLREQDHLSAGGAPREGGVEKSPQSRQPRRSSVAHLPVDNQDNTDGGSGPEGEGSHAWWTASHESSVAHLRGDHARASLYINIASAYCSQGEHTAAHGCCTAALALQPRSVHALLALVYVELCRGNVEHARALLARGRPPPGVPL